MRRRRRRRRRVVLGENGDVEAVWIGAVPRRLTSFVGSR